MINLHTNRQIFLDWQKERKIKMNLEFKNALQATQVLLTKTCKENPGCIGCFIYQVGGNATIQNEDGTEIGTLTCNTGIEKIEREKENKNEKI
jgi:hypothetical protein